MKSSGGRTRPVNAAALTKHVEAACLELGYLDSDVAAALAYVMWARWHEDDAPLIFRSLGHRIKRDTLVQREVLPQSVLTDEAWAAMTSRGREVGPVQAYNRTIKRAAGLWLEEYKTRNPRWIFAFRRAQEGDQRATAA